MEQGAGDPAGAHLGAGGADVHLDLRGAAGGDHGQVHRAEGHQVRNAYGRSLAWLTSRRIGEKHSMGKSVRSAKIIW